MSVKCKVKMTDKLSPVEGSVKGLSGKETGTCPECETPGVMLSIVGGFVRAHVVATAEVPENNPQAPTVVAKKSAHPHGSSKVGKALSEPITTLVDTGIRMGDPRQAEQRRLDVIEGAAGIGVVKVPRKVATKKITKSGAPRMVTKMVEVPATEEHVREARSYWVGRNLTSDGSRKRQNEMVSSLNRRLEAILASQVVQYDDTSDTFGVVAMPVAEQLSLSAAVDTAQAHRGPTLVRGRDVTPRTRDAETPWDESTDVRQITVGPKGKRRVVGTEPRKATTFEDPLGRERFDRKITDVPEPAPKLSQNQKRRLRRARHEAQLRQGGKA